MTLASADKVQVASTDQLREWLLANHAQNESVWLVTYKKSAGTKYVSASHVLDELVSFGWTDGIRQQVDDERTMQLISPRRTKIWAKTYKDRADRLIAEGRMHKSGQASVDEAKASGAWNAMSDVDELEVPSDLAIAFSAKPNARANFDNFPKSTRRNILRWIASAKKEQTRAQRVIRIAEDAKDNVRTPVNG